MYPCTYDTNLEMIQPVVDPVKYHTVGLHGWQRQKFGRNVRIKFFSRVEIGFNDVQPIAPNYHLK
jgi:hypothetical protein